MNVILDVIAVIGAGCRGGLSDEAQAKMYLTGAIVVAGIFVLPWLAYLLGA